MTVFAAQYYRRIIVFCQSSENDHDRVESLCVSLRHREKRVVNQPGPPRESNRRLVGRKSYARGPDRALVTDEEYVMGAQLLKHSLVLLFDLLVSSWLFSPRLISTSGFIMALIEVGTKSYLRARCY